MHVGYAKLMLENWAAFSFPRSLSVSVIMFSFITIKKKNVQRSTIHRKKILNSL